MEYTSTGRVWVAEKQPWYKYPHWVHLRKSWMTRLGLVLVVCAGVPLLVLQQRFPNLIGKPIRIDALSVAFFAGIMLLALRLVLSVFWYPFGVRWNEPEVGVGPEGIVLAYRNRTVVIAWDDLYDVEQTPDGAVIDVKRGKGRAHLIPNVLADSGFERFVAEIKSRRERALRGAADPDLDA